MIIKPALFACVIAAAFGCRSDRIERDLEYGRVIEPAGDRVDQEHGATESGAGQGAAAGTPALGAAQEGETTQTDEAGHTVHDTGANRQIDPRGTQNQNTGAAVQGRRGGTLTNPNTRSTTRNPFTRPMPAPSPASEPATPPEPESGTSETASGHGTTTNTGINTENAGQGGTDNPQR